MESHVWLFVRARTTLATHNIISITRHNYVSERLLHVNRFWHSLTRVPVKLCTVLSLQKSWFVKKQLDVPVQWTVHGCECTNFVSLTLNEQSLSALLHSLSDIDLSTQAVHVQNASFERVLTRVVVLNHNVILFCCRESVRHILLFNAANRCKFHCSALAVSNNPISTVTGNLLNGLRSSTIFVYVPLVLGPASSIYTAAVFWAGIATSIH